MENVFVVYSVYPDYSSIIQRVYEEEKDAKEFCDGTEDCVYDAIPFFPPRKNVHFPDQLRIFLHFFTH